MSDPAGPGEPGVADVGATRRRADPARDILRGIFDLQFRSIITTRMMPAIYTLIMVLAVLLCAFLTVDAFLTSWAKGVLWLLLIAPTVFLSVVVVARIVLELILALFTLLMRMEQMTELVGRMSGTVEGVAINMPRVPFLRGWRASREAMQDTMDPADDPAGSRDPAGFHPRAATERPPGGPNDNGDDRPRDGSEKR